MFDIGAWPFQILPRDPYINPIKKYFHSIKIELTDALENNI